MDISELVIERLEIDDEDFKQFVLEQYNIDDLFSDIEIKDYVTKEFNPDDVFSITDLETWADENDYVYKEEE